MEIDDSVEYGTIKLIPKDTFYEPNLYYYKSGDDYYYGVQKERIPGVTYYKLKAEPPVLKFYEPNKFWSK